VDISSLSGNLANSSSGEEIIQISANQRPEQILVFKISLKINNTSEEHLEEWLAWLAHK